MAHSHEKIEYDINEVKEVFNAAVMVGTIIDVDRVNDKADVNISGLGTINNVPIFYHCPDKSTVDGGSAAFSNGDSVYILNKKGKANPPVSDLKIVGFVDELKVCGGFVVVSYAQASVKRCFVWNAIRNKLAEFNDAQGDPIVFPCDYADIENFLPVSQGTAISWSINSPFSHLDDCTLETPSCPSSEGSFSDSDSCSDSEPTPSRPGKTDSVQRSDACTSSRTETDPTLECHLSERHRTVDMNKTIVQKNINPTGRKAEYGGFSDIIVAERNSSEVYACKWDAFLYSPSSCTIESTWKDECSYNLSEVHSSFIPLLAMALSALHPSIVRCCAYDGISKDYHAHRTITDYDYCLQVQSKVSETIIVNVFVEQYIKRVRFSETFVDTMSIGCPCWPVYKCNPDDLHDGPLTYPENRSLKVKASVDYIEGGTDGINPFIRTVHAVFSDKIKELVEDFYTQLSIPDIEVGSIPFAISIH